MSEVFSDYVASLGANGEPPDLASYEKVRSSLRTVLVNEMHKRGLWRAPPSFLGVIGASWDQDALDELVSDAYSWNFVRRLRGLRNQQRLKDNIRPLVIVNVRRFLTERQKQADPLGYRLFGRLREAVEQGIDRGEIMVRDGAKGATKRVAGNGTVLSFQPTLAPLTPRRDFEEPVRRWNDELLPELVTAEGPAVPRIVRCLGEKVVKLRDQAVAAFRFGDLIAELKDDVRKRWRGVWHQSLGELGAEFGETDAPPTPVKVVRSDQEPDWPRRLVRIQESVAKSIDAQRLPKMRRDLWSLWQLIRSTRLIPEEVGPLPTVAALARELQLDRERVRQLFERLWPIVRASIESAGRRPETEGGSREFPDDPTSNVAAEWRDARIGRGRR